jgi:hypothetical protein
MRISIFLFFLALFAVTTAGHIYTIDSYLNYAVTKSVASRASLEIPKFMMTVEGQGRRYYSKLGIGQSLVSLPFYGVGSLIEKVSPANPLFRAYSREFAVPHEDDLIRAEPQTLIRASDEDGARVFFATLTNAVVAAVVCVLFWMVLRTFGLSPAAAFGGTLLLGFGTPLWVYSRDLFSEPLFACCLVAAFYLLRKGEVLKQRRNVVLAGLVSSLGILARVSFLPIALIFGAYIVLASDDIRVGMRRALVYGLYCLPGLVIVGLLNLVRFGGFTLTGYHTAFDKGFSVPLGDGLAWNLVSPYRSVFVYAPSVTIFFLGWVGFARKYRAQLLLITTLVAYVFIIYSKWWAWHGGWCWGPRFLLPVIPLLLLPGLVVMREHRTWLLPLTVILGIAGFIVQIGAVLINYTAVYDYWIKIGRLDWAEVRIHMFSPVTTHLKAVLATSPANYDLWIIQTCRTAGARCLWIILIVLAITTLATTRIIKGLKTPDPAETKRSQ